MKISTAGVSGTDMSALNLIRDVWAYNLEEEIKNIRKILNKYNYVAMDTEFPGVVARPVGDFTKHNDYPYQVLRCNVNLLRVIQIGLTFLDENGQTPDSCATWQFNFQFDLSQDIYATDSIYLLQNAGIQFERLEDYGIEPIVFAEELLLSGIMKNAKWLSFHAGFDFAYLIKLLTYHTLPESEKIFFELLHFFFPIIYDVKYLMECKNLQGGLQSLADDLNLVRIGTQHQAGSDSLLTGIVFFKLREIYFNNTIDNSLYAGRLYGLGTSLKMQENANSSTKGKRQKLAQQEQ